VDHFWRLSTLINAKRFDTSALKARARQAGIMPDKRPTVAEAATSFMVVFGNSPDVRARAERLLETLRQNPQWPADDVQELRRLIEERLRPKNGSQ
jgi:hypothetical protein